MKATAMTTRTNSEGTIRIVGTGTVYETHADEVNGEIAVDLMDDVSSVRTTALTGAERDEPATPERQATSSVSSTGTAVAPANGFPVTNHVWAALLPAIVTVGGILLAATVGPSVWSPERSVLGELAVRAGHVAWFGTSLVGTVWTWNDATAIADRRIAWSPNLLEYTIGGALTLALGGIWFYLAQGYPPGELGVVFVGLVLVGLPTASVFAGPVYLLNRYRNVGALAGTGSR